MATNPRIPEQNDSTRRGPSLVPKPEAPSSAVPGVALAIITAVLILVAIVYFMPRAPKSVAAPAGATTPSQPVNDQLGGQLHLSGLKMTEAPTRGAVNLDAQLTNSGGTMVNGVMAEVDFPLANGQMAAVQAPVQGIATDKSENTGRVAGDTQDLTQAPIQAGDTKPVRITVNHVPDGWNHQIPQVRILETTGTTAK